MASASEMMAQKKLKKQKRVDEKKLKLIGAPIQTDRNKRIVENLRTTKLCRSHCRTFFDVQHYEPMPSEESSGVLKTAYQSLEDIIYMNKDSHSGFVYLETLLASFQMIASIIVHGNGQIKPSDVTVGDLALDGARSLFDVYFSADDITQENFAKRRQKLLPMITFLVMAEMYLTEFVSEKFFFTVSHYATAVRHCTHFNSFFYAQDPSLVSASLYAIRHKEIKSLAPHFKNDEAGLTNLVLRSLDTFYLMASRMSAYRGLQPIQGDLGKIDDLWQQVASNIPELFVLAFQALNNTIITFENYVGLTITDSTKLHAKMLEADRRYKSGQFDVFDNFQV